LGGLQRRRDDDHSVSGLSYDGPGTGQCGGLPRAGGALDDDQSVLAGQRGDGPHLLLVEVSAGDHHREAGQ